MPDITWNDQTLIFLSNGTNNEQKVFFRKNQNSFQMSEINAKRLQSKQKTMSATFKKLPYLE